MEMNFQLQAPTALSPVTAKLEARLLPKLVYALDIEISYVCQE